MSVVPPSSASWSSFVATNSQPARKSLKSSGTETGSLVTTFVRRFCLRWWSAGQMEALLGECGAARVRMLGTDDGYVAIGYAS